jgi:hypothetical protein
MSLLESLSTAPCTPSLTDLSIALSLAPGSAAPPSLVAGLRPANRSAFGKRQRRKLGAGPNTLGSRQPGPGCWRTCFAWSHGRAPAQCLRLPRHSVHASCWPCASRRHAHLSAALMLAGPRAPDQQRTAAAMRREASAASIASPAARCHPVWRVRAHRCLRQLSIGSATAANESYFGPAWVAGEAPLWDLPARQACSCWPPLQNALCCCCSQHRTAPRIMGCILMSAYHRHHQVMFVPTHANVFPTHQDSSTHHPTPAMARAWREVQTTQSH